MRILKKSALFAVVLLISTAAFAQATPPPAGDELAPGSSHLITPEDLLKVLQSPQGEKPLILNVGPFLLYRQAHIADSEYVGPGSDKHSLEQLRAKVKPLPRGRYIVLYCGCCPWSHCPNVQPAFKELSAMGFTNVKVLYIADNFGTDWVYKGYPTVKGQ